MSFMIFEILEKFSKKFRKNLKKFSKLEFVLFFNLNSRQKLVKNRSRMNLGIGEIALDTSMA